MNRRRFLEAGVAAGVSSTGSLDAGAVGAASGRDGPSSRTPDTPVAFVVRLHVRPGREEEFLALLRPVLDAMRHEPTFINAVLHRDPEDSTRFMIYETWSDLDDVVEVQARRPYRKAYLERLPEILAEDRQIEVWQPLRGDFGSASKS